MQQVDLKQRRALFWDVAEAEIEAALQNAPQWVVPRVFQYGTLEDIDSVISLYGEEKTREILMQTNMEPVTRSMAFLFLGIDKDRRYAKD